MIEVGRVAIKIVGREAGKHCVIVDILDKNFVLIDGEVKRRRCNIDHLEFLPIKLKIRKGASREKVLEAMVKAGIIEKPREEKPKKPKEGKLRKGKK
jgi:large subunit ribosomal protein L14e